MDNKEDLREIQFSERDGEELIKEIKESNNLEATFNKYMLKSLKNMILLGICNKELLMNLEESEIYFKRFIKEGVDSEYAKYCFISIRDNCKQDLSLFTLK